MYWLSDSDFFFPKRGKHLSYLLKAAVSVNGLQTILSH